MIMLQEEVVVYPKRGQKGRPPRPFNENNGKSFKRIRLICAMIEWDYDSNLARAVLKHVFQDEHFPYSDSYITKLGLKSFSYAALASKVGKEAMSIRMFEKGYTTAISKDTLGMVLDIFEKYICHEDNRNLFKDITKQFPEREVKKWQVTIVPNTKSRASPKNGNVHEFKTTGLSEPIGQVKPEYPDQPVTVSNEHDLDLEYPI
jgi:hypothetical protein